MIIEKIIEKNNELYEHVRELAKTETTRFGEVDRGRLVGLSTWWEVDVPLRDIGVPRRLLSFDEAIDCLSKAHGAAYSFHLSPFVLGEASYKPLNPNQHVPKLDRTEIISDTRLIVEDYVYRIASWKKEEEKGWRSWPFFKEFSFKPSEIEYKDAEGRQEAYLSTGLCEPIRLFENTEVIPVYEGNEHFEAIMEAIRRE